MNPLMLLGTTALSGGLSFLSSIGQRNAAKRQERLQIWEQQRVEQYNREMTQLHNDNRNLMGNLLLNDPVNIAKFAADGEALGFNRQTWLQALPLYSNEAAYKLMTGDAIATSSPMTFQRVPSAQEGFAAAGMAALNTFTSGYKTMMSQDMQWNMLERQIEAMAGRSGRSNSNSGLGSFGIANPFVANAFGVSAGGAASMSGGLSKGGTVSDLPYPAKWEQGKAEVTNPFRTWNVDKDNTDAETYETRYGDIAQELFGAYNFLADSVRTVTGRSIRDWGRVAGMNIGDYASKGGSYMDTLRKWYAAPSSLPNRTLPGFGGSVTPYVPFAGGGRGVTYGW